MRCAVLRAAKNDITAPHSLPPATGAAGTERPVVSPNQTMSFEEILHLTDAVRRAGDGPGALPALEATALEGSRFPTGSLHLDLDPASCNAPGDVCLPAGVCPTVGFLGVAPWQAVDVFENRSYYGVFSRCLHVLIISGLDFVIT